MNMENRYRQIIDRLPDAIRARNKNGFLTAFGYTSDLDILSTFRTDSISLLLEKFLPDRSHPIHHVGLSDSLSVAFEKACQIAQDQLPAYQQQLAGYIALIASTVYAKGRQLPYRDNPDANNIVVAMKHMRQNLHRNLNMEEVAAEAGMSYSKFRKVFKAYSGYPPAQYFLRLKMERAKDYLQSTSFSCKEISFRLGFDSASYFNKMFRLSQGLTPMEYRAKPPEDCSDG